MMSEDDERRDSTEERGPTIPSDGHGMLAGLASGALDDLQSGSLTGLPTNVVGSLASAGTSALGKGATSLPPQVAAAATGVASSFAQQGLDGALGLVKGLLGKQALPKVEYTLEVEDGPDVLWQVHRMHFTEALSEPYALTLDLATENIDADIDAMLGASVELKIERDVLVRQVCGIINQVEYLAIAHDRLQVRVRIGPAMQLLRHRVDTRLWQDMNVPDVIEEVLAAALGDYQRTLERDALTASYEPREYIVQYRESDLDFVHRLMEEEGITYWFDHVLGKGKEVLVLEDSNDEYADIETIDDDPSLNLISDRADEAEVESVQQFGWARELTSTSVEQRIFDWRDPLHPMVATGLGKGGEFADERHHVRAVYHHGHFVEANPEPRTLRKLMHARQRDRLARGFGNVTGMFPGRKFAIVGHPLAALDQQYLIRRITHIGNCPEVIPGEASSEGPRYQNQFECMVFDPADPHRPPQVTPRPRIHGPQTAIVTGPAGEEIHTDEHGRVKVLFNWDRVNQPTDDTSMWIRVAHHWAGPGFGTFFVPRIGMEVVVEFIEGDPAKPLINGCVYNGVNSISVGPAENKTQSVIRTRSSPSSEGYNEILFEDAKGSERIALHAQKDLNETVENSHSTTVKGGQSNSVGGDQSNTVSGKQTESVTGAVELTYKDKRTVTITGTQEITVNGASNKLTVTSGSHSLDAGTTIELQAPTHIKLSCGTSSILITPHAIILQAAKSSLTLDGSAALVASEGTHLVLDEAAKSATLASSKNASLTLVDTATLQAKLLGQLVLDANAKMSSAGKSVLELTTKAELTGAAEATVQAPKSTLTSGAATVEASAAGVSVSGGKVDLAASGVATVSGAMVKIN
jgi:type VI secretion system secreted protein VgrG